MKSLDPDPLQRPLALANANVVVLGYDADARDHAHALRRASNHVTIAVPADTTCFARAVSDGFVVDEPVRAVTRADVVVVLVRQLALTWRLVERYVPAGALVVFRCARALEAGVCSQSGLDIVLVAMDDDAHTGCRIAVHRHATTRAMHRAIDYARAACGTQVALRGTSITAEADLEIAEIGERVGSLLAFAASTERLPPQPAKPPAKAETKAESEDPSWFHHVLNRRSRM
jgi:ketol-acid reductoisomerase